MSPKDVDSQTACAPGFLAQRWGGCVPFKLLFWRDMVVFGSMLNLTLGLISLMFLAKDQVAMAITLHYAAAPYNLFLFMAVQRHAERTKPTALIATGWLLTTFLI